MSGDFYCYNNQLTTLKGCLNSIGDDFGCRGNPFIPSEMRWILKPMAKGNIKKFIFDEGKIDEIIETVRINMSKVPVAISVLVKS